MQYIVKDKLLNKFRRSLNGYPQWTENKTEAHVFSSLNGAVQSCHVHPNVDCTCEARARRLAKVGRARYRDQHRAKCALVLAKKARLAERFDIIPVVVAEA